MKTIASQQEREFRRITMEKTSSLTRVLMILVSTLLVSSANATTLSFDYTGTIISSPDGIVALNTPFSGSFSYDDGLTGSTDATGTRYSPVDFSLDIDSTDISFTALLNVDNDSTLLLPGYDVIQIGRFGISPNPLLNGSLLEGIEIDLSDNTQSTLTDESLPLTFDLSEWSSEILAIRPLGSTNVTMGRIDTLSSTIPEPASLLLLGSGLVGMLGLRRWKK